MKKIAGLDIGTTGCKCSIYTVDGVLLCESYAEYNKTCCLENEIDGIIIWECVLKVIKEISIHSKELKAIGVTSFGETMILLDEHDKPLMKSMLYTDLRGEVQCNKLTQKISEEEIVKITGLRPHGMYSISKIMWIKENHPDIYKRSKKIMLFEDFIVYMLSGISQIDYSLASRTMAFDIKLKKWSKKIFYCAGIDSNKMSNPVPIGTKAGTIKPELAAILGLEKNILIVSGCHDQIAAAVGVGALKAGMAVDGTGTVECITPIFDNIPKHDYLSKGNFSIVPFAIDNTYASYAFLFTGGALLKWYRDKLMAKHSIEYECSTENTYDYLNKKLSNEPSGLLVLPHFSGAGTPYMDINSKGAIIGLTTATKSIDIYRAIMEGVTYEMRLNIEYLEQSGVVINELRATGGGARSAFWLQLKADILNIPIVTITAKEAGTVGCIMIAGVACGLFKSLEHASETFIKVDTIFKPRQRLTEKYSVLYSKYKRVYHAVKTIIY